ncbi:hypothetical protein CF326_g9293 [Tilletia indica]|nr:hypothetical protein CF326_g9293 [Tilletia indica]
MSVAPPTAPAASTAAASPSVDPSSPAAVRRLPALPKHPSPPSLDSAAALLLALRSGEERPGYLLSQDRATLGYQDPLLGTVKVPTTSEELLEQLGKVHHDVGHFGADVTGHAARRQLWVDEKDLTRYVHQMIAVCEECQLAARGGDRSVFAPLHMMPRPKFLGLWSFDFVGPLTTTRTGNSYILTAIEHVTNWPLAVALPARSSEAAVRLLETIVTFFGKPASLLTDNGAEFISYAFTMALSRFGIKPLHTSPYHPQTNGKVERFNADLVNILRRLLVEPSPRQQWDLLLPAALLAYRAHPLTAHGKSPAMLLFGADPVLPSTPIVEVLYAPPSDAEIEAIQQRRDDFVHDLNDIREKALDLQQHQRRQEVARRNRSYVDQGFQVGDKVLRIKNDRKTKLEPFWDGPFFIFGSSAGSFQLQTMDGYVLRALVPGEQLKLALDANDRPLRWQLQNNARRLRHRPRKPVPTSRQLVNIGGSHLG